MAQGHFHAAASAYFAFFIFTQHYIFGMLDVDASVGTIRHAASYTNTTK